MLREAVTEHSSSIHMFTFAPLCFNVEHLCVQYENAKDQYRVQSTEKTVMKSQSELMAQMWSDVRMLPRQ